MSYPYEVDERHDPDLQSALERDGERGLAAALAIECRCGHERHNHMAATGALGSFGGTACEQCWTCGTFTPTDQKLRKEHHELLAAVRRAELDARDAA